MAETPGVEKVDDLLKSVHDGSFVIPYFQRGFEWEPRMVCELFESILQDYYTGLLLFWGLNQQDKFQEVWDPIWGAELKGTPNKAVLDGQQRLSSLYYAIYNPKKMFPNRYSYYVFYMNLIKILNDDYEESITYRYYSKYQSWENIKKDKNIWAETGIVPISILSAEDPTNSNQEYLDSIEFEEWLKEFLNKNKKKLPAGITTIGIAKVFNKILKYNFVSYSLSNKRKAYDICNIFARVNAKGMRLSTFDLMNAFLYPKGVKLRKELWENLNYDLLKEIDPGMNEYLLKLISLIKQNYCSSKYIYNLIPGEKILRKDESGRKYEDILVRDGKDFEELWDISCKYAEKARQIIMNDFSAIKTDFIPNTTIVPVLGAILHTYKGDPDSIVFKNNLKKWYWSAVLSEDYSGSSDSVMAKDFRDWKEWMDTKKNIERIDRINLDFINNLNLKNVRKGSAQYKAILCLLAHNHAVDFYKEWIIGKGDFSYDKINDHHIFPKKINELDPEKSKTFNETKDCILNKTLLLEETNTKISNKMPSQYIEEMIEKHGSEDKVKEIFLRHLISEDAYRYMKKDDYDKFIFAREKTIKEHIISILEIKK
ncbi:MAG: DUF262 domain-containing protein [Caldisericia bacterium]|nr:DUF262 domain-containing protein [Caldisericia bacterium]